MGRASAKGCRLSPPLRLTGGLAQIGVLEPEKPTYTGLTERQKSVKFIFVFMGKLWIEGVSQFLSPHPTTTDKIGFAPERLRKDEWHAHGGGVFSILFQLMNKTVCVQMTDHLLRCSYRVCSDHEPSAATQALSLFTHCPRTRPASSAEKPSEAGTMSLHK